MLLRRPLLHGIFEALVQVLLETDPLALRGPQPHMIRQAPTTLSDLSLLLSLFAGERDGGLDKKNLVESTIHGESGEVKDPTEVHPPGSDRHESIHS